jgi:Protein of unknown function (DUF736)
VGRAEIGAAWSKHSEDGCEDLSLGPEDDAFSAPIWSNLFSRGMRRQIILQGWRPPEPIETASLPPHPAPTGGVFTMAIKRVHAVRSTQTALG